ncbi:MAG: class I SAM-dependent methyltransferase [Flavobacteriaceae bacterium]
MEKVDWFTDWFNTSYYHTLYKNRNDEDAQLFMRNITEFLKLPKDTHILDLPCGKGRHSMYLNSLGYQVTGGDLSENSISYAKQFKNDTLRFKVKDMRESYRHRYDTIFNLFTSFGYFEDDQEDILVLQNMKDGLKKDGVLVLDFLNVVSVKNNLVTEEIKTVDGIEFHIERKIKDGFILKHISFNDKGRDYAYTEQVKYIDLEKFKTYFAAAGFTITHTFGDYQLSDYDPQSSDRLILVAS